MYIGGPTSRPSSSSFSARWTPARRFSSRLRFFPSKCRSGKFNSYTRDAGKLESVRAKVALLSSIRLLFFFRTTLYSRVNFPAGVIFIDASFLAQCVCVCVCVHSRWNNESSEWRFDCAHISPFYQELFSIWPHNRQSRVLIVGRCARPSIIVDFLCWSIPPRCCLQEFFLLFSSANGQSNRIGSSYALRPI